MSKKIGLKKLAYYAPFISTAVIYAGGFSSLISGLVMKNNALDDFEATSQYREEYIIKKDEIDTKFTNGEISFSEYKEENEYLNSSDFTKDAIEDNSYYFNVYDKGESLRIAGSIIFGIGAASCLSGVFWRRTNTAKDLKAEIELDKKDKDWKKEKKKIDEECTKLLNSKKNKSSTTVANQNINENEEENIDEREEQLEDINDYLARYK